MARWWGPEGTPNIFFMIFFTNSQLLHLVDVEINNHISDLYIKTQPKTKEEPDTLMTMNPKTW